MNSEVDSIRDEYVSKLFTFGCIELKCLKQEYLIVSSKRGIHEEFKSLKSESFQDSGGLIEYNLVECKANLNELFKNHLILQQNTLKLAIDSSDSTYTRDKLHRLLQCVEDKLQTSES